jgi:short-subunit dehydrogenase
MKIEGKNILLTGASRGIGRALAEAFAKQKARLFLVSRSFPEDLKKSLQDLGASHIELIAQDLSKPESARQLKDKLDQMSVSIDILVNNAGLLTGGLLENQKPEEIQEMFQVNVISLVNLTRMILPDMLKKNSGLIINNASVSGYMFFPCASTYAASKAAVVGFTRCIEQELKSTGVKTLLLVTPGVQTEMYEDIQKRYGDNLDLDFLSAIPSEKWAEEVIKAIKSDKETLWPKGSNLFGVHFARHFPNILKSMALKKFRR